MSAVLAIRTPTLLRELWGLEMGTDRQSVSRAIARLVGCSGNMIKLKPQRVVSCAGWISAATETSSGSAASGLWFDLGPGLPVPRLPLDRSCVARSR
jgi:hypothetical protein